MQIGELAEATGISRDTLRYYEKRGLLRARRGGNGYRDYPPQAADWLRYIRTAQTLGFTLQEIEADLPLLTAPDGDSATALRSALQAKLTEIDRRIDGLQALRGELAQRLSAQMADCPMRPAAASAQPLAHPEYDKLQRRAASIYTGRMVNATFRFYEELNDFLPRTRRKVEFTVPCAQAATTKHMIEALGVPHTEVELILVNGESCGFGHLLRDGDRVAVYPKFETFDVRPLLHVRAQPLRTVRFVADAHMGGLARLLRMAGFDTLYDNRIDDPTVARLSRDEGRIALTRDRDLLKRRGITHGCYVRALKPAEQFAEMFQRLDLAASSRPFTLCLACNTPLRPVARQEVTARLPPLVRATQEEFLTCDCCNGVFWRGSHWRRMQALLASQGVGAG